MKEIINKENNKSFVDYMVENFTEEQLRERINHLTERKEEIDREIKILRQREVELILCIGPPRKTTPEI